MTESKFNATVTVTPAQLVFERVITELRAAKEADPSIRENFDDAPSWDEVPLYARIAIDKALGFDQGEQHLLASGQADPHQGYGPVGYAAYVQSTGGKNYRGEDCPPWDSLPEAIKAAWGAAATSVRSEHEYRNASDYDMDFSHAELAQLVAGLDALQRAGGHEAEVAFPLRSRLRGVLFKEPEPTEEPASETESDPKLLPAGTEEPAADLEPPRLSATLEEIADSHAAFDAEVEAKLGWPKPRTGSEVPPVLPGHEQPAFGEDAPKRADAAPEQALPEGGRSETTTDPSPPPVANSGLGGASELPSPSASPGAPHLDPLNPQFPPAPALPTHTDPPPDHGAEVEGPVAEAPAVEAPAPKAEPKPQGGKRRGH